MNMKLIDKGTEGEILLSGRLDANSAPEAEEIILETAKDYERLVLNLKDLTYISSAGIRLMKVVHMTMKKKDGILVLKNVGPMVMEVFELTGFSGLLNFE